jgi:hypothetical protein
VVLSNWHQILSELCGQHQFHAEYRIDGSSWVGPKVVRCGGGLPVVHRPVYASEAEPLSRLPQAEGAVKRIVLQQLPPESPVQLKTETPIGNRGIASGEVINLVVLDGPGKTWRGAGIAIFGTDKAPALAVRDAVGRKERGEDVQV